MRAGNLKDKIEIQKLGTAQDEVGQITEKYEKFADAYTEATNLGSKEKYFNGRYEDINMKKFRIRYIPGITTDMRIKLGDELYDIKEVIDPYNKRRELLISAKKV